MIDSKLKLPDGERGKQSLSDDHRLLQVTVNVFESSTTGCFIKY